MYNLREPFFTAKNNGIVFKKPLQKTLKIFSFGFLFITAPIAPPNPPRPTL